MDAANCKRANIVLAACVLFNLSIGVLYAWSVMTTRLTAPLEHGGFGWSAGQAGLPFSVATVSLALAMLIGGRVQDRIGPRRVVTTGALMIALGMALAGLSGDSVAGVSLSFGVIAAAGMGLGYSCVTPPALKWFHPSRKGLISGLIVGGFGLSAVGMAPLTTTLLGRFGIEQTFMILGAFNLVVSTGLARLVCNPPPGYVPREPAKPAAKAASAPAVNLGLREMLATPRFYLIFAIFLAASSVGVMMIGNVTRVAHSQAGITDSAVLAGLVALMALANSLGRVAAGFVSDKIGRINTLFVILILLAVNMAAFAFYQDLVTVAAGIIVVGFCFGGLLSVMPALCADQFGLENFGLNYGVLFLAWGLSGVGVPVAANFLYESTGSFHSAYILCAVLMAAMVFVNIALRREVNRNA